MTTREKRTAALSEANASINDATFDDMADQAKKVAANMFMLHGDKTVLSATGFIYACQQIHEAALLWLLADGYVVPTDKSRATDEERAAFHARTAKPADAITAAQGQYL